MRHPKVPQRVKEHAVSFGQACRAIGRKVWVFLGPVQSGVRNELQNPERRRIITKMAVGWVTGSVTMQASLKREEFLAEFWVPLVFAAVIGLFDALMQYQSGKPRVEIITTTTRADEVPVPERWESDDP